MYEYTSNFNMKYSNFTCWCSHYGITFSLQYRIHAFSPSSIDWPGDWQAFNVVCIDGQVGKLTDATDRWRWVRPPSPVWPYVLDVDVDG